MQRGKKWGKKSSLRAQFKQKSNENNTETKQKLQAKNSNE